MATMCPSCGSSDFEVEETWQDGQGLGYRRLVCNACDGEWDQVRSLEDDRWQNVEE